MGKDPELLKLLEKHGADLIKYKFQDFPAELGGSEVPSRVLHLAIQTMLEELAPNLWEDSLNRLVDFGHIFSLELEMDSLFADKLYHGEAVAIDMAFSVMQDSKMCAKAMYERVKFSQGQKVPLPVEYWRSRIFNDVSQEQMDEALVVWNEL